MDNELKDILRRKICGPQTREEVAAAITRIEHELLYLEDVDDSLDYGIMGGPLGHPRTCAEAELSRLRKQLAEMT